MAGPAFQGIGWTAEQGDLVCVGSEYVNTGTLKGPFDRSSCKGRRYRVGRHQAPRI